ncbi:MAG: glucose 1-dehydrogenase [Myxococcales bacterium]|nr:glucose 1-dehydrogenase [Myxococcales bacterium]
MPQSKTRLEGKVAIVTGGSRGIGEAIARAFLDAGAKVVVASRKVEESFAKELGPNAAAVAAHTGKEADCVRLVEETVKRFGKVDVLVNNAAANPYFGPMLNIEQAAWDKTFEVNVKGYFFMTREVAKHAMEKKTPAAIVNVASVAGLMATPLQGAYAMTKAAVISMTKTLAVELAGANIRVNAIAPGFIKTKFASAIVDDKDLLADVVRRTPLGRVGDPAEIAGGALYLASDEASYLTGHTLVIDGGLTIG